MSDNKMIPKDVELFADQETYSAVRGYIIAAQKQVYTAVNAAMVSAYWNIGKRIYDDCGENERAAYGKQLMAFLAEKLTEEFGKGFSVRNLQMMRQFYLSFPNANALRSELSWTHYRTSFEQIKSSIKSAIGVSAIEKAIEHTDEVIRRKKSAFFIE